MAEKYATTIDGVEYDITEFMKTHPGGDNMLILAAGRDSSILFHSYHRYAFDVLLTAVRFMNSSF